ncbi:hypothetical protein COCSADRAFT_160232 [Bipolaris sorokiniana ND90Pr]|uniref:Hydrophobin n=1 Tax=Cochliobolus sativus (strain ND90Pr / ATCC 201652) TaxID=665912 RepID=M2SNV5_COCSN|nr:uncharacterized protein COCSADRAFT_160232 [Bipolaris sorokiniana ND90Pr]EMD63980.1 hypothetical protein COCSADRAFT_160232 [Bipolaris sorokiniana ND90Pr]
MNLTIKMKTFTTLIITTLYGAYQANAACTAIETATNGAVASQVIAAGVTTTLHDQPCTALVSCPTNGVGGRVINMNAGCRAVQIS